MPFNLIIIGSELLTGKRKDAHLPQATKILQARGLELGYVLYLADKPVRMQAALKYSMSGDETVFCFGGIGATPDDHTRAAAAAAAGVPLLRQPEAAAIIEERFGESAYPQRIRMADLPAGCSLIPNPINRVPGFTLNRHHFVPGFPQMAWPMIEWVLDRYYVEDFGTEPAAEFLLCLPDVTEGQVIGIMERFVAKFPDVELSCLPHMDGDYRETELGVRGRGAAIRRPFDWLCGALRDAGFEFTID